MYTLSGAIIAGGQAQRMAGAEKGLVLYQGQPMVSWVIQAMQALTTRIYLNVNRQQQDYQGFACILVEDLERFSQRGPLSGLYSVLASAQTSHLLFSPCDTPNISAEAFTALWLASQHQPEKIHCLQSATGLHPLHGVIPVSSGLPVLEAYLEEDHGNSVMGFFRHHGYQVVDWGKELELLNINYQQQLVTV